MRITGACFNNSILYSRPLALKRNNNSNKVCNKVQQPAFTPSFLGIINFKTAKDTYNTKHESKRTLNYEFTPENYPDIPEKYLFLFDNVKFIKNSISPILDNFEDVYNYADNVISKVNENYDLLCKSALNTPRSGILDEVDDNGITGRSTKFDNCGSPEIIRDYINKRVILFDNSKEDSKNRKYTVFLDCEDVNNPETIKAKKSYTFESGMLSRYTGECTMDINPYCFVADEAFTFKRNVFKSYDKHLTVAGGAEYSSEYYEFKLHPSLSYYCAPKEAEFRRFVKNKVSANNIIRYSTDEFLMSQYAAYKN